VRLRVITGVGPGHETMIAQCRASIIVASARPGRFTEIEHAVIDDAKGVLGAGGTRNEGMKCPGADWFFFVDADDVIESDAFELNNFDDVATFGAIKLVTEYATWKNVYPCTWRDVAINGAGGTLIMGFFCRADVARTMQFDADDDVTDDFEFFLRLPSFTKVASPLITKRTGTSAGGPRRIGHKSVDWTGCSNELIRRAVETDPAKFSVVPEEVLSKVAPYR
jgi:hypothetical protein